MALTCVALASAQPPMPVTTNGFNCIHEGNSLMGPFFENINVAGTNEVAVSCMAQRLGYRKHHSEQIGIAGTPIDYLWYNRRMEYEQVLATKGPFDVFIVQPFGHVNSRLVRIEAAAAAQMFRRVLAGNSNAAMLVYQTWPQGSPSYNTNTLYFNDGAFASNIQADFSRYLEPMLDVLRQDFPSNAVYALPAGEAFVELYRRIQANGGSYGGFTNLSQIMDEGGNSVHPNRKGYYLSLMTHLSCLYQATTATQGMPYAFNWYLAWQSPGMRPTDLTSNEAQALQEIAWDVTRTYPRTPMTGGERVQSDMTPPSAPSALWASNVWARQADVYWQPSTDNVGVTMYTIYANGEYLGDATQPTFTVGGLLPGQTNRIRVRAWDASYNLTDAEMTLVTSSQYGNVIMAWDTTNLKVWGATNVPVLMTHPLIQATTATVVRGAGIGYPAYGIPGIMPMAWVNRPTLSNSIAAQCYFGFTLAPTGGAAVALDSLDVIVRGPIPMNLALLSSLTGFTPSNALYTHRLTGETFQDYECPLRSVPALQAVTNPVEFRFYPYGATVDVVLSFGHFAPFYETPTNEMRMRGTVVPEPGVLGELLPALVLTGVWNARKR